MLLTRSRPSCIPTNTCTLQLTYIFRIASQTEDTDTADQTTTSRQPKPLTVLLQMDAHGVPRGPPAFLLPDVGLVFRQRLSKTDLNKPQVIQLCPYIAVDETDERFCFSTLLIHMPWPRNTEASILTGANAISISAVAAFAARRERFHPYVARSLDACRHSQQNLANTGEPRESADADVHVNADDLGQPALDADLNDAAGIDGDEDSTTPLNPHIPNVQPQAFQVGSESIRLHLPPAQLQRCHEFIRYAANDHADKVIFEYTPIHQNPTQRPLSNSRGYA